ncbi:MAG: methyltransferase domain-containing protein [Chloroflexota bacterium]
MAEQTPQNVFSAAGAGERWRQGEAERARWLGPITEAMLDAAGVRAGSRVLDVAAGTGEQSRAAARRVGPTGSVLATDISESMLTVARQAVADEGLANVEIRQMDGQHLDLDEASFDAVISRLGLMLLPDLVPALRGMRRLLRPGCHLGAIVYSLPERNPYVSIPRRVLNERLGLPPGQTAAQTMQMFALSEPGLLTGSLESAGFNDVRSRLIQYHRHFPSVAAAVAAFRDSNPMVRDRLVPLPQAEQTAIWSEIERALAEFQTPNGAEFGGEMLLAWATK